MGRWFRLDDDVINDPKVLALSESMRWHWVALLCVASKNNGQLPSLRHAALGMRLPERRAAAIVAGLASAGLLDRVAGGYFEPHNWSTRQFRSDVVDATNAERQKRYRDRQRNAVTPVTPKRPDTDNRIQIQKIDDGGEARAREPLISAEAHSIADQVQSIFGLDPTNPPPSWYGAAYRVQQWLAAGWKPEIILAECCALAAKKRDGPPNSIAYCERPIASAHARQDAPLPVVVKMPAQTVEIRNGKDGNVIAAADQLVERLARWGDAPGRGGGHDVEGIEPPGSSRGEGAVVIRLLPEG